MDFKRVIKECNDRTCFLHQINYSGVMDYILNNFKAVSVMCTQRCTVHALFKQHRVDWKKKNSYNLQYFIFQLALFFFLTHGHPLAIRNCSVISDFNAPVDKPELSRIVDRPVTPRRSDY